VLLTDDGRPPWEPEAAGIVPPLSACRPADKSYNCSNESYTKFGQAPIATIDGLSDHPDKDFTDG